MDSRKLSFDDILVKLGQLAGQSGKGGEIEELLVLLRMHCDKLVADMNEARKKAGLLDKMILFAVFSVDKDRRVMRWKETAAKLNGFSVDKVIGRDCIILPMRPAMKNADCTARMSPNPLIRRNAPFAPGTAACARS